MTTLPFLKIRDRMPALITFIVFVAMSQWSFGEMTSLLSDNPTCDNVTSSGSISGAQSSCGSFYPSTIASIAPAAGGTGPVEYQWMYKNASTGWALTAIPGATSVDYTPGFLSETTKFRRCARNQGCTSWPGETNDVTITITNVCCNVTSSGTIGNAQTSCGAFDPLAITSLAPASGGTNLVEYVWMYKNASTGWNFQMVAGADSETYDPGFLTETTVYRRCARNQGCTSWPGETNDITMTVNPSLSVSTSSTSAVCADTIKVCDISDYNGSRTIWMPNLGGTTGVSLFTIINNSGKLYQFNDGTAHFTGKAQKTDDTNKQWIFSIWFKDKKDWTDWSAGGGSYKNGGGSTDGYLSWDYYIMDASKSNTLTGLGDYNGVELNLTHKPSNHLYAMQLGSGANDQDASFGMSFWFDYTSSDPNFSSGNGDFNSDASCSNQLACEAVASASITGGTAPFIYEWSNGIYGNEAKGLCAGTYSLTVTDASGCMVTVSETVASVVCCNDILPGTIGSHQSNCGPFDPAIINSTAPAIGSAPAVEYIWLYRNASTGNNWTTTGVTTDFMDPGMTTETTDYIRCARNQGCITYPAESNLITITIHPALDPATISSTDASAFGVADGTATITANGGTSPYSYLWSDGQTTATATGLAAGTYSVTTTDANGCSDVASATINEPVSILANITTTDVLCNGGNDGSAIVTVSGGATPYTYLWSDGQTTATAAGLSAGSYSITATDANGYTVSTNAVIDEPSALTLSTTATNVLCNGDSNGSATVTVAGGTLPYTYLWSDGQTTAIATGLSAGTYTVTVTDANGCTSTSGVTINEPTAILSGGVTTTDVLCNGSNNGTASVTLSGGTMPYAYLWSDGQTTATATGLASGVYSVTVTDANGCTITESGVTITQPVLLESEGVGTSDVSCFGACDGTAAISVDGGTFPYTYLWSDGQVTPGATGLCAGTYSVTVTDANGCTLIEAGIVINEPAALTSSVITMDVLCNGDSNGSATVAATGGTAPYTYLWSDGQTATTATGLFGGTYSVTVTDANGCTSSSSATINEPLTLTLSSNATDALCNGDSNGSATVTATGGTMPYTYLWSNGQTAAIATGLSGGTYSVTVTDANGCTSTSSTTVNEPIQLINTTSGADATGNGIADGTATVTVVGGTMPYSYLWSDGQSTATATGLLAGTYSVTVTDANGCITTGSVTVNEPAAISASITTTDALCNGDSNGSATVTATGGVAPYTYLWSGGQTTAIATGLLAGAYTVTVTDANGYTTTANGVVNEPLILVSSAAATDALCNGDSNGSATVTVTGGTMPYTYLWSNGQTAATATGLTAGVYSVIITDANGCTAISGITVNEPTVLLSGGVTTTDVLCNGTSNGTASITISGGTMPYAYLWSDGQTTATATGLASGVYSVTVTDANGCTITESGVTITQPVLLESEGIGTSDASCFGACDGTAAISVDGGTFPYTYLWSDGQVTPVAAGLCAGTYSVTVTDANGCTLIETGIVINEPAALTSSVITMDVLCNGDSNGSATVAATGGTGPYTYLWSDGQTTATATGLAAGTYSVTVSDANGCQNLANAVVNEPTPLVLVSTVINNATCFATCDGSITVNVAGGTAPYTYAWSVVIINQITGDGTPTVSGLCKGLYSVVVTDANGCTITINNLEISEPGPIFNNNTTTNDVTCNGGSDGSLGVDILGGDSSIYIFME